MLDTVSNPNTAIHLAKVVGVRLYQNDVEVVREGTAPDTNEVFRGDILMFSRKSRLRLAFVASNTPVNFRTMITLTYPKVYPTDGKRVKVHLNHFLVWLRRDLGRCEYLWFLEFQVRGAPHVHIVIDRAMPRTKENRRALQYRVSASWYRIVGSGDEKHLRAGTRVEAVREPRGGARYAIKYAWKMRQKAVPQGFRNVGRFWGYSRAVKPLPQAELQCTEEDIRGLLENWEYAPSEERTLYRVLYNQADRFRAHCADQLDKCGEQVYNGPEDHTEARDQNGRSP